MIEIFLGRGNNVFAKIDSRMRDRFYVFNNGKNCNSLAVFLYIALRADEDGWSYASYDDISQATGINTRQAITDALSHLCSVLIDGNRIFEHYKIDSDNGKDGRSVYLIFPDLPHRDCPFGKIKLFTENDNV